MKRLILWLIGIGTFFSLVFIAYADYPQPTGYVNDYANVISQKTEDEITQKLKDYDKKSTNQIAVVTVQTTEPESIEDYTYELFKRWKVGQKGVNNGVMMIFAMKDHHMRIEVGRGLEGDLTDIESKHILDDVIKPEFKAKNYDAGVSKGVDAVILSLGSVTATDSATTGSDAGAGLIIFLIILIIIIVVIAVAASPFTPLGGAGTWGITDGWSSGSSSSDDDSFGGFGGGSSSGGGASSSW